MAGVEDWYSSSGWNWSSDGDDEKTSKAILPYLIAVPKYVVWCVLGIIDSGDEWPGRKFVTSNSRSWRYQDQDGQQGMDDRC